MNNLYYYAIFTNPTLLFQLLTMNYLVKNSINNIFTDSRMIDSCDQSYFIKFFQKDFSTNTKQALLSDFRHFIIWYHGTNQEPFTFRKLTESDISGYKQVCLKKECPHANSTINRRITHLRMLCEFAIKEKRMKENVAKNVKLLPIQQLAPKSLEASDVRKILKQTEIRGKLRDQTALLMALKGGFRVSELANMKIEDVFISDRKGHIKVRGKRGKEREVPLNSEVRELLSKYIANRDPSEKVFQGQRGKNTFTPMAFSKMLEYYSKKAGVRCHMHQLRHTFSFNFLAQNENDLVALADILGHQNLSTTARYSKNRLSDLQNKVEKIGF